ncbi:MAG: hypothetical protein GY834_06080 [Bacteroidetes bacterium]|nr:hypothetical protein [Bacteroidota bacterium]
MKISNVILSWDFVGAIVITLITALIIPANLNLKFCISFYSIGITVLSIIFSIFFAALAIIMSSSDNDFIEFLEENDDFTVLLDSFKITLVMLFISLIYSIVLHVISEYAIQEKGENSTQNMTLFLVFEFLFAYSLFATGLSVKDTIKFSHFRSKFLNKKNKKNQLPIE